MYTWMCLIQPLYMPTFILNRLHCCFNSLTVQESGICLSTYCSFESKAHNCFSLIASLLFIYTFHLLTSLY